MAGTTPRARKRAVAVIPALALVASGFAATGATGMATAAPQGDEVSIDASEYYMNYAAPRAELAFETDEVVGSIDGGVVKRDTAGANAAIEKADALDRKFSQGNPQAARGLAQLEAKSIETGKSPKQIKQKQLKQSKTTQEAKLLKGTAYRQKIADGLFNAVRKYQTSLKSVDKVAEKPARN